MDVHPYGWLSLWPSLVAIVMAIASRRVVLSMLAGIFVGALLMNQGNPAFALGDTLEIHLWKPLIEEDRLRVFAFTLVMGAMVGVIEKSGGMQALVDLVSPWARNRRRGQLTTWMLGMVVFFDDYANSVLLGQTLQPLCARLKISREKLAYLVDSTAAPVSGLALISTWVAGEIGFVQAGLAGVPGGSEINAFALFVQTIPYRFYVLWSLAFVFLIGMMQRDFGPMLAAERKVLQQPSSPPRPPVDIRIGKANGWWNAVLPVLVTVLAVLVLLYHTGLRAATPPQGDTSVSLWMIFGAADSYFSLLWGSFAGLTMAVVLVLLQRLLSWSQVTDAIRHGAQLMMPALVVLWLASALSAMTGHDPLPGMTELQADTAFSARDYRLYTGEYLASLLASTSADPAASDQLARWLPSLIFLLAAGISFATGTSWGTMAIVMPVAIPLAYGALAPQGDPAWHQQPILICTVGSVLAGSIFGDHCSPISDTTVLSSQACGCEHTAHVWTQLPYAVLVALVSVLLGTLPVGWGLLSVWWLLPLGVVALVVLLLLLGRPTAEADVVPTGGSTDGGAAG